VSASNRIAAAIAASLVCLGFAARAARGQHPRPVEVSAIPALNFDADEGFGYGAIVALYSYDANAASYAWTLQPTVFLTTRGRRDYTLFFDSPSRPGRAWRTTAFAGHEQQLAAPYYGIGNATPYDPALETGGTRYFYRYGRTRDRVSADVQHDVGHRGFRVLAGAGVSNDRVDPTPFDSGTTLAATDGMGASGTGHTNYVRAGLVWDTRDREIGPRAGTWADLLVQRVDRALGATNSYTRATVTVRRYQPLGDRVTLAARMLAQSTSGDAPFYVLGEIQTAQRPQEGLGGASTVRGLPKDRYLGKSIVVSNVELRWRATEFALLGRPSSLVLSSFVDAGRVWPGGMDVANAVRQLHAGYGGGARLSFGSSFVVAVDVGHSTQAAAPMYIGLGYLF